MRNDRKVSNTCDIHVLSCEPSQCPTRGPQQMRSREFLRQAAWREIHAYSQKHSLENLGSQPQAWCLSCNWRGAAKYWECSVVTAQGAGFLGSTTTLLLRPEVMGDAGIGSFRTAG